MLLLGLIAEAQAAQVTLAWDANSEPDLSGYKLYYGTSSGNYPNTISLGLVTTDTVTNLTDGVTYYFALTAFDAEGFESGKSNEVSYTPPASQFTLTVSNSGTGSGTVTGTGISCGTDCSEPFNTGTSVSLTAAAAVSSTFTGWTGACSGTTSPCTFTMNANAAVTAAFALITYNLTATVGANGSISPSGGINVNHGASQTFTITPNTGYQIASVTVDGASQGAIGSYTFINVTAPHTIQAAFAINTTYTLTVSKTGTGTGTVTNSPAGTSFTSGTVVSLTAAADASSTFTGWTGACSGTTNPCTVTMNANKAVTATFALKTYTLTASAGSGGSISPTGGSNVNYGASQTYTITPNTGYQIAAVTVDGVSQGAIGSYTFSNVTAAHTIQASFSAVASYTLTVSKTGTGTGTVTNSPAGTSFTSGTVVSLTAAAAVSSTFTGWTGACSGTTNPCTVTMNAAATVTVAFALKTYTLTASAGANGSISPSGGINVNHGASQTFIITPNTGYRIASVTVDGVSQGTPGSYSFSNVTAAHTIQAAFAVTPYTLTVSKNGTGSGTVTAPGINCGGDCTEVLNAGTSVSLTALADTRSTFAGWTRGCTGTANPCTFTISANTSVTAVFNQETNKPTSSISSPTSGATLRHSAAVITGAAADGNGSGVQKVEVSTDGGTTWKTAGGTILWNHSWNAPGNGTYVIKTRATDNVGNVETPGAGVTVTVAPYQPTPVDVSGKQLLVNGTPFTVKGVVYSPVPIGEDPNASPYGDYFTAPYSALHNRDLPVLRTLGANAVRLYHWEKTADHFNFLDQAFNGGLNPIYVIAGYWINEGLDIDPISPTNVRNQIKADFQAMVAAHKDHPALLMWSVGHNLNLPDAYGTNPTHLFSLINDLAEAAHLEEGAKAHPVTTALADQDLAATLSGFEGAVPALDLWGANVYRGSSFGTLFSDIGSISQKPLLLLEYGIDAYDNTRGNEYELTGNSTRTDVTEGLWKEIAAHGQTCVGGTIMSYSDEWWKGRYTGDASCPADPDPARHGRCGFATITQPDGYANEEWWGIVRVLDNGTGPDQVEPRAVYYRLQYLWGANTLSLASPNGGETWQVGKPQTIAWNYAGTPGTYVKIELLKNGSIIRTITKSAKIGANGSGSYTWTPPWKLGPGSNYKIRVTSISNNQINDTSDANFIVNSYQFVSR